MAYAAVPAVNRRLDMWFDGPQQQRRWTVLIRIILAIPQLFVLAVLEIALFVVTVIGWFAALVMGRLPDWVHRFNSGYTRWYARFYAYVYLLTDEYPAFEFDDLPYPARPILPPPGRLNRLAVLFRLILAIPAYFFQVIVTYGLGIPMLFVVWVIMVFTGRMPRSLYWAYSSWVRYAARVFAYMLLITPEYPWGMLGDRGSAVALSFLPLDAPPPPPPTTRGFPPPYAPPPPTTSVPPPYAPPAPFAQPPEPSETATAPPSSTETPGEAPAPVPPPAAPAWPPPPPPGFSAPGSTLPPPPWDAAPPPPAARADADRSRLVLPRASRNWLVFAIVWGSILFVAYSAIISVVGINNTSTTITQYNTIVNDFNDSKNAINAAATDAQRCTTISCLRDSHLAAAASLDNFHSDIAAMNLPSNAQQPAQVVQSDLTQLATVFTDLANSANLQAYRSTVERSNLQALLNSLPNDTNALLGALRSNIL